MAVLEEADLGTSRKERRQEGGESRGKERFHGLQTKLSRSLSFRELDGLARVGFGPGAMRPGVLC
jgi:hypothetical protein